MGHFCLHPYGALLSIQQDVTLRETHQDASLGSPYEVTTRGTNQVELLECKHAAPCRRGCSALVFLVTSLLLCSLQERNNLSEVHNTSFYPSILTQATAADCFQGKSIGARKVQHNNFPSATFEQFLALGFPKPQAVFVALSLTALMDLPAGNVSHCFLNHLCFWYSQCLAALCFTKYMLYQKGLPFAGFLGNEETHLTMASSRDHSGFYMA